MLRWIPLRAHTTYSLSDGMIAPEQLAKLCARHGYPAVGVTETNQLFSALEVSTVLAKAKIQPILGLTLDVRRPSLPGQPMQGLEIYDRLVCLARNDEGWVHLMALASLLHLPSKEGGRPHVTFDQLASHREGLLVLTGGHEGALVALLAEGRVGCADQYLSLLLEAMEPEAVYVEIGRHGLPIEQATDTALQQLAARHRQPLVATHQIFFSEPAEFEAHDVLRCIAAGRYLEEEDRPRSCPSYYFPSEASMVERFSDLPKALAQTVEIAFRCSVMARGSDPVLPRFTDPAFPDWSEERLLERLSFEGLTRRLEDRPVVQDRAVYEERLRYELSVINGMGFSGYFLIVSDFIRYSKQQGIPVGPGRGSGAGSLVAWVLDITDLDPLRFGLLFERFLNPERVSMPDFDIDFCQERRDEVIDYVRRRYGEDRVAHIITFGKLQARAVLRDVGRVLQMPYGQVDRICKLVPSNPAHPVSLEEALRQEPALAQAKEEDTDVQRLIAIGLQLEGMYRHASVHAAGIVIADRPLTERVPLYYDGRSPLPVLQYSMKWTEAAGLVKFDFLGLKTLSVMAQAERLLLDRGIKIAWAEDDFRDAATYRLMTQGHTLGIFQFEGKGMRDALRKLRPDTIEDLIALGALYRPGPMDNIPTYIARKHGREAVDTLHPSLASVLRETFGVMIYQEQVMKIAQILAGYSLGEADLLRRAMGKKIQAEMDSQRDHFVSRSVARGVDESQAASIFDQVAKFAGYGFNKSHAAAYAVIAYQTAFLKANYGVEFICASMNLDMHDTDKLQSYVEDARRLGVTILPPSMVHSRACFGIELLADGKPAIRYGLAALKSVGLQASEDWVAAREARPGGFGGVLSEIGDVLQAARLVFNRRQVEVLIKAGAFDLYDPVRSRLLASWEALAKAKEASGGHGLPIVVAPNMRAAPMERQNVTMGNRLEDEHEAFGFYFSGHPLDYLEYWRDRLPFSDSRVLQRTEGSMDPIHMVALIGALRVRTAGPKRLGFLECSDHWGRFELSCFDAAMLEQCRLWHQQGTAVVLRVERRLDRRQDPPSLRGIVVSGMPLAEQLVQSVPRVTLPVHNKEDLDRLVHWITSESGAAVRLRLVLSPEVSALVDVPGVYFPWHRIKEWMDGVLPVA